MGKRFYKYKPESLVSVDKIITVHYLEYPKNYVFEGEEHEFWEFVYVDKGFVYCSRNREPEFKLDAGELLFHPPGEFHTIRANGTAPANICVVSFASESAAADFFKQKRLTAGRAEKTILKNIIFEASNAFELPPFEPDLRKMRLKPVQSLPGAMQMLKIHIETLLITLIRRKDSDGDKVVYVPANAPPDTLADEIKRFLAENAYKRISLDDLCAAFNYSRTFLCTRFKAAAAETIFSAYNRLKIEKAKELIRNNEMNLSEISALLSFDSYSYFTKTFKKLTGYTPREYKGLIK